MPDLTVDCRLGTHLSSDMHARAAELLSWAYTRWQNHPANTNPVKTDTSQPVYERLLKNGIREVVMVFDGQAMVGVFVHSLSPHYDQYPLRKLSFLGIRPSERGFEPLKAVFRRYSRFMDDMGEDVCITSDLDQATLNSLLAESGFRESEDRNETYYVLSQLLARKVVSSQKVQGDFVVDEIITVDGKSVRRDKKLLMLQTTPLNFYEVYRRQQRARLERSLSGDNRAVLAEALSRADEGLFFISDYVDTITRPDPAQGGFDSQAAIFGPNLSDPLAELSDPEQGLVWMLPRDEAAMAAIADKVVLRPGFFDFLSYCFKVLGSYCVTTGVTSVEVQGVLSRCLHPDIRLTFGQMVEQVLAPAAEPVPGSTRTFPDGLERTAWRFSGSFVERGPERLRVRKEVMVEELLGLRGSSRAPVVFLGRRVAELSGLRRLFTASRDEGLAVLVLDFGQELTRVIDDEFYRGRPEDHPRFSVVNVRDFYQVPVMLECLGLSTEPGVEFVVG